MQIRSISGRFAEIVATLVKYGFHDIVDRLDIPGRGYFRKQTTHAVHLTKWERMRKVLEDLGPTFIKCGQILSQRADLIPRELIDELRKLQDEVPAEDFPEMQAVLEDNFKRPLPAIFAEIDETPIAAASLAQVHRAVLLDGRREVALKIQRPGIAETIRRDLDIMERIAHQLDGRIEYFKVYNLPQLVNRIRKLMLKELDFICEMRNMQAARSQLEPGAGIDIPEVFPSLCRKNVLTMAFSRGRKMKDIRFSEFSDREGLARAAINFSLRQVLVYGFFHADPHPGNILIDENETIVLVDWGMVGWLSPRIRQELVDVMAAIAENDVDEVTDFLMTFTTGRESINRATLQNEILEVISQFTRMPFAEMNLGVMLIDLISILRFHGRILTADLSIMIKSLITAEETAKLLCPDLDVMEEIRPVARRMVRDRFAPTNLLKGMYRGFRYLLRFQQELPRQTLNIVGKLDRGELAIRFRHENLEGLQGTLERIVNRLVLGIIVGTLFVGSGMIIMSGTGPTLWGYPALGMVGYIAGGLLCLKLLVSMVRSRKG